MTITCALSPFPSPSPSADPDKLHSKLEALRKVEKLCGFYENLKSPSNEPKNILVNLCDGLEKFLGYDKTSKGYDGTGIAYSDLDRLCDGVMGFLHGVLESVKDDDAIKTYDNKAENIEKVISTLNNKIGHGRAGLVESVAEVKGWLEGYEKSVKEMTGNITTELSILCNKLDSGYEAQIKNDHSLEHQLSDWTETVKSIDTEVKSIEDNHVSKLDTALKKEINGEIKPIKTAVKMLKESSLHDGLIKQARAVDWDLREQKEEVLKTIEEKSKRIQEMIEKDYEQLAKLTGNVRIDKREQIKSITACLNVANGTLEHLLREFDAKYYDTFQGYFNEISQQLTHIDPNNKHPSVGGDGTKSKLQLDVDLIGSNVANFDEHVTGYVKKLNSWISTTEKLIKEVMNRDVQKIIALAEGGPNSNKETLTQALIDVERQTNMYNLQFQGVKKKLDEEVKKVNGEHGKGGVVHQLKNLRSLNKHVKVPEALKTFKDKTTEGWNLYSQIDGLKMKIVSDVKKHVGNEILTEIQETVASIKGAPDADQGLEGIRKKMVDQYAKRFTTEDGNKGFEGVVVDWLRDIMENNVMVKKYIANYIENNSDANFRDFIDTKAKAITSDKHDQIALAIKDAIKSNDIKMSDVTLVKDNVQKTIDAVYNSISGFVDTIGSKIMKEVKVDYDNKDAFVTKIVEGVENTIVRDLHGAKIKLYLKRAVHLILAALHSVANQALDDLDTLAGFEDDQDDYIKLGENVDKALTAANGLHNELKEAISFTKSSSSVTSDDGLANKVKAIDSKFDDAEKELYTLLKATADTTMSRLQDAVNFSVMTTLGTVKNDVTQFERNAKTAKNALLQKAQEISAQLNLLCTDVLNRGDCMKTNLTALQTSVIGTEDNQLAGIKNDLYDVKTTDVQTLYRSISSVVQKIEKLQAVPADVETKRQKTVKLTTELRLSLEKIRDQLGATALAISQADETLSHSIDVLEKALYSTKDRLTAAITTMQEDLTNIARNAFEKITNEVRSLFANSHLAHLSALKTLLTRQLKIISCTVNKDLNTGLKGFLKTLSGESIDLYAAGHDMDRRAKKPSTPNLLDPVKNALDGDRKHGEKVRALTDNFKSYSEHIFGYLLKDMAKHFTSQPDVNGAYTTKVSTIRSNLTALLDHIIAMKHFDHLVPGKLETLKTSLTTFTSSHFRNASYPVLDAFPQSLVRFVGELERMYVSRYEGEEWNDDYVNNYAKIMVTITHLLYTEFGDFRRAFDEHVEWKTYKIYDANEEHSLHALYFSGQGYDAGLPGNAKYGELNHKTGFNGQRILDLLSSGTHKLYNSNTKYDYSGCLLNVFSPLLKYYQVCHLNNGGSSKVPCSVFEMLTWLCSLQHNAVYKTFARYCESIAREEKDATLKRSISDALSSNLPYLSLWSHKLLTTIVGTGDALTTYASDYFCNYLRFHYPSTGEDCLQMVIDILCRVFPPLRFLESQCTVDAKYSGWASCLYGKHIPTTKSQCSDKPTDKSICQAKCEPTCQPNCRANCQPTSPLMSYLNDCLPGHLPHHLRTIGCKAKCTTCPSNKPGMPCLTPLGFRGFSGSTKTGEHLCDIIGEFFNTANLSGLFCISPKPPSTLPEHFTFALFMVRGWVDSSDFFTSALQTEFAASVRKVSIGIYDNPSELTSALCAIYGDADHTLEHIHPEPKKAELSTLSKADSCICPNRGAHCSPYLSSLCSDFYNYLAPKHTDTYLSWTVHLPWTLYRYLQNLLEDFKNISCRDWGCSRCQHADKCKPGKHGVDYNCQCRSLVGCRGVQSTFYRYGFTFGNSMTLLETNGIRYCRDFCNQLTNVLNSEYFKTLFEKCDEFIFTIRQPFIWLNVALWSLSLFYLICVMVGRLDVLHIRSHLRIPSSHKIAAQSLLAAAQVGRLAKISYLQP